VTTGPATPLAPYVVGYNQIHVGDAFSGALAGPGSLSLVQPNIFGQGTVTVAVLPEPAISVTFPSPRRGSMMASAM
jgi:hypothetical protein